MENNNKEFNEIGNIDDLMKSPEPTQNDNTEPDIDDDEDLTLEFMRGGKPDAELLKYIMNTTGIEVEDPDDNYVEEDMEPEDAVSDEDEQYYSEQENGLFADDGDYEPEGQFIPEDELSEEDEYYEENSENAVIPHEDYDNPELDDASEDDSMGETDMNLRIAFGLEDDDEDESVNGSVKRFGDKLENEVRTGPSARIVEHYEYTDPTQARDIAVEFRKKGASLKLRLILSIIVTAILLLYENITPITSIFGKPMSFDGFLNPEAYPVVYIMVSLQMLAFVIALALPEITRGFKRLFSGAPTPESLSAVVAAVGVIGSFLTAATTTVASVIDSGKSLSVYNGAAAVAIIMTLVYAKLTNERNTMSFFIAGSRRTKYSLNCELDEDIASVADDFDEEYCDVLKAEKTGFIDGFFSRISTPDKSATSFTIGILGASLAVSILFSVLAGGTLGGIAQNVYLTFLAMCPLSAFLTYSYPFFRASKIAAEEDCAIIGDVSAEEYASASMVTLNDVNVFPSFGVKVQNIKIYNNARIDRLLYYAASVFARAGGPLSDVFEVATVEVGRSEDAIINEADDGFLSATVENVNITFGSCFALTSRGFDIPEEVSDGDETFSDEMSIMYMFREDKLVAKMYVKYILDGDVENTLMTFRDNGMCICVRTYDPNIDEDMIRDKLAFRDAPIKVVKYRSEEEASSIRDRADSGMVTISSPRALIDLLPYCDKIVHTKRTCSALGIMSIIISTLLLGIFAISGKTSVVNSLNISIYHLLWTLPTFVASKIFIK